MVSNQDDMCDLAVDYYRNVFKDDTATDGAYMNGARRVITAEQNDQLTSVFDFDEFTTAVAQMHPEKYAGPDGFSPAFFQHFWNLLGHDIFNCCTEWLAQVSFPEGFE